MLLGTLEVVLDFDDLLLVINILVVVDGGRRVGPFSTTLQLNGVSVEVIIVGDSRVTSGSVCATVSLVLSVSLAFQVYRPKVVVFGKNEIMR